MTQMRIGDRERESASRRLAEHFAEGRLDDQEYAERLDAVWSARTADDLGILFHDLPAPVRPPAPVAVRPRPRRRGNRSLTPVLVLLLVAMLVTMLVGGLFTHVPWWILLIALVLLLKRGSCR